MTQKTEPVKKSRFLVGAFGLFAAALAAVLAAPGAALADPAVPASAGADGIGALTTSATSSAPYFSSTDEAVDYVREQLIARETPIKVQVDSSSLGNTDDSRSAYCQNLIDTAMAHTGDPKGGDYLRWQIGSYETGIAVGPDTATITYKIEYFSTAAQEAKVDQKVAQIVNDLGLKDLGEYERIVAIYDYITSNVAYDYENLSNESYTLKFTAYAALVNGKAVCQGVAALFYRLALESGLQVRVVSGTTKSGEDHAWNIVSIAGKYYNLDCTWDLGVAAGKYRYLLKCDKSFSDRTRDEEYATADFTKRYPMAASDYKVSQTVTLPQMVTLPKTAYSKAFGNKAFNLQATTSGDGTLKYVSSNTKVATVSSTGAVTIKGVGETTISVYAAASSMYAKSAVKKVTVTVAKGANTLVAKGKTATVKRSAVKAKNKVLKRSAVLAVSKAKGTVTYTKASGNKKIVINKNTGKVTVKKGLAKGTYTVKVKVKAAGTSKYKALTKAVAFKIKVK